MIMFILYFLLIEIPWFYLILTHSFRFFPKLKKKWQNVIGNVNIIINTIPAVIIYYGMCIVASDYSKQGWNRSHLDDEMEFFIDLCMFFYLLYLVSSYIVFYIFYKESENNK